MNYTHYIKCVKFDQKMNENSNHFNNYNGTNDINKRFT